MAKPRKRHARDRSPSPLPAASESAAPTPINKALLAAAALLELAWLAVLVTLALRN